MPVIDGIEKKVASQAAGDVKAIDASFILFLFEFCQNSIGATEVNNLSRFRSKVVDAGAVHARARWPDGPLRGAQGSVCCTTTRAKTRPA